MISKVKRVFLKTFIACLAVTSLQFVLPSILPSYQTAWAQEVANETNSNVYPVNDEYILPAIPDRLEWLNRKTFAFNRVLELFLLRPVARVYLFITPKFFRTAVTNVTNVLRRPLSAINALLQGDLDNFFDNVFAFTHNILFGVGGLVDFYGGVADHKIQIETFDQTLGVYGVGYGSYLVLPVLNSSSIRGLFGLVVDSQINPVTKELEGGEYIGITVLGLINVYANNLDLIIAAEKTSLDLYAGLRDFYYKRLINSVYNGDPPPIRQADPAGPGGDGGDDLLDDL
ncbi:MAG: VacJ family lipoprotein [Alphaproteobacteria bacterium]|nr:VacJ family lipoprotein [Alphaproteobacteria bacterium]